MLTERALESFKQFVETNIAYAMVEYGGTMHKAKILTRERLKDGRVALSISITPEVSGTTTITGMPSIMVAVPKRSKSC